MRRSIPKFCLRRRRSSAIRQFWKEKSSLIFCILKIKHWRRKNKKLNEKSNLLQNKSQLFTGRTCGCTSGDNFLAIGVIKLSVLLFSSSIVWFFSSWIFDVKWTQNQKKNTCFGAADHWVFRQKTKFVLLAQNPIFAYQFFNWKI